MAFPKLQVTKNYRMFTRSADNRPVNLPKHKALFKSMQNFGFLPCYPVVCIRDKNKALVVRDGQHRLAFAEQLGLPVVFIVVDEMFDIAAVNNSQVVWNTRNYAETFAAQGRSQYQDGLDFADRHGLPVGIAFGMLAGTSSFSNVVPEYKSGQFKIKDRNWAEVVGFVYSKLVHLAPKCKGARLIEACMAVARVPKFEPDRLISGAERAREKLMPFATREAYLGLLEDLYNFGRSIKNRVPLKMDAEKAMHDRNAASAARKKAD
jgi:hypothetical protein